MRDVAGFASDVLLVPLPGHTFGQAGVAVRRDGKWLLLAGDAYFYHREMDWEQPWCTPGLRAYQTMMEKDRSARLDNQRRLRKLRHEQGTAVDIFSSHDVSELERCQGARSRCQPKRSWWQLSQLDRMLARTASVTSENA